MTIDSDTIDGLIHVNSNDTSKVVPLKKAMRNMLRIWKLFYTHQNSIGNPINEFYDWISITKEQFDMYRSDPSNFVQFQTSCSPRKVGRTPVADIIASPVCEPKQVGLPINACAFDQVPIDTEPKSIESAHVIQLGGKEKSNDNSNVILLE